MNIWTVLCRESGEPEVSNYGSFSSYELARKFCEQYVEVNWDEDYLKRNDLTLKVQWYGEDEMYIGRQKNGRRTYYGSTTFLIQSSIVITSEDDFRF